MRMLVVAVALLGLVVAAGGVSAEIGTADNAPAATLLLPYFEVDLDNPSGQTTLFSINNASATAILAHVTLWTDEGIPTFAFDVYLTGYDVQTINLRDIFNGNLPVTADDGADPADTISPKGLIAQDINFPDTVGPCGDSTTLYNAPDPTLGAKIQHIQLAHTGKGSPIFGGRCSGFNHFDNIARGYITVDTVTQCNLLFPNSTGYFSGIATSQNVLWGDYIYVNPGQNFSQGDTLVHIEACTPGNGYNGYAGNGAGQCPFGPGDYTFYGRFVGGAGTDQRESLATTFATRYVTGGAFNGGTDLLVWRDPKVPVGAPGAANGPHSCGARITWYPLDQAEVVSFDEQENATLACFVTDNVPPAIGGSVACFPLAAQRVSTAQDLQTPTNFGWLYLNLNTTVAGGLFNPTAQAWVTTTMSAEGRYSAGFSAIQLDNANATFQSASPGGQILPVSP